jgi:hypothetical protein
VRPVLVADQVEDADQDDRDRPGKVQGGRRTLDDRTGIAQVGVEVVGGALRAAGQERPGMRLGGLAGTGVRVRG